MSLPWFPNFLFPSTPDFITRSLSYFMIEFIQCSLPWFPKSSLSYLLSHFFQIYFNFKWWIYLFKSVVFNPKSASSSPKSSSSCQPTSDLEFLTTFHYWKSYQCMLNNVFYIYLSLFHSFWIKLFFFKVFHSFFN